MSAAYFIAGTDTDVGKTTIAAGLLHAARGRCPTHRSIRWRLSRPSLHIWRRAKPASH